MAAHYMAMSYFYQCRYRTFLEHSNRCRELLADDPDFGHAGTWLLFFECMSLAHLGEFRKLRELKGYLRRHLPLLPFQDAHAYIDSYNTVLFWLANDDPQSGKAILAERRAEGFGAKSFWDVAELYLRIYEEDCETALSIRPPVWEAQFRNIKSPLQMVQCELLSLFGRSHLLASHRDRETSHHIRPLRRISRKLRRVGGPHSVPWSAIMEARLAVAKGNRAGACDRLQEAAIAFDALEMKLYAAVTRRRRGELQGGSAAESAIQYCEDALSREEIVNTERFANTLVPPLSVSQPST